MADPSGEEASMLEALVTVVMDEKGRLVRAIRTFSLRLYMDCTWTVHGLYMDRTL